MSNRGLLWVSLVLLSWIAIGWLLYTHHYLIAGFLFLYPDWTWDGALMTRQRWAFAQNFFRLGWFVALVVYGIRRWL